MHIEGVRARKPRLMLLTPLIDVVFILLVFFMLASSFLDWRALRISVPAVDAAAAVGGSMLVRVHADGSLDLNGEPVQLALLVQRMGEQLGRDPQQRILVQPRGGVALQALVTVLDALAEGGAGNLALIR